MTGMGAASPELMSHGYITVGLVSGWLRTAQAGPGQAAEVRSALNSTLTSSLSLSAPKNPV